MGFDAFGKGITCEPEHPHRRIVEPWWLRAPCQSNIDGVGNLGCQVAAVVGTELVEKDCRQILAVCSVNFRRWAGKSIPNCANY